MPHAPAFDAAVACPGLDPVVARRLHDYLGYVPTPAEILALDDAAFRSIRQFGRTSRAKALAWARAQGAEPATMHAIAA